MKKLILAALVSTAFIAAAGPADPMKEWQTVSVDGSTTYTYTVQPATVKSFVAEGQTGWAGMIEFEATGHAASSGIVVVTGCDVNPSPNGQVAFLNDDGTYVGGSKPFVWDSANLRTGNAREYERIAALVCLAGKQNASAPAPKQTKAYINI